MRIILAGGGTGGPVTPLIAVQQKIKIKNPEAEFLFIDAKGGAAQSLLAPYNIPFRSITTGKLRRYFSLSNLLAPLLVGIGFIQSLFIVAKFKPDLVFSAGGFVSVPVVLAAKLLGKKTVIHQQDAEPSLTNQILAPLANLITVSLQVSEKIFSTHSGMSGKTPVAKVAWTGNPVREEFLKTYTDADLARARAAFGITAQRPVILVFGGATGALSLNKILAESLPAILEFADVLHGSGRGKMLAFEHPGYHQLEIIGNMADAFRIADLVICRAGFSTITELSAMRKPALVMPIPESHQMANARILTESNAAVVLAQNETGSEQLIPLIRKLMYDARWQRQLADNISSLMPHNSSEKIADLIISLCSSQKH